MVPLLAAFQLIKHVQTTLDPFMTVTRNIVNSMTAVQSQQPNSLGRHFFRLPAELRCIVYTYLFAGAVLDLSFPGPMWIETGKGRTLKATDTTELLRHVTLNQGAILSAYQFCRKEALYSLASSIIMKLDCDKHSRDDIFCKIDQKFLQHVTAMSISPDTLIRADRKLAPRLKQITLTHASFDLCSFSGVNSMIHALTCPNCGDPKAGFLYTQFKKMLWDWDWKRKQLLYLAEEYGWRLRFILHVSLVDSLNWAANEKGRMEFEYHLATEELVSKTLLKDGNVIMEEEEFHDQVKLMKLEFGGDDSDDE